MSTIEAKPATDRRAFLSRALVATAGVTIAAGAGHAAPPLAATLSPAVDPIIELIAEEDRWRTLAVAALDKIEASYFAIPKSERPNFGDYRAMRPADSEEADRTLAVAQELFGRIFTTKAITIEGAIAQIETLIVDPAEAVEIVVAGLRDISAKGGAA